MSADIFLSAGGVDMSIRIEDSAVEDVFCERYSGFFGVETGRRARLHIGNLDGSASGASSSFEVVTDGDHVRAESGAGVFEYDFNSLDGSLLVKPDLAFFALENALRIIFGRLAPAGGSLLVHAAGIVPPGRDEAVLFHGPSEAGKSTLAEIALRAGAGVLGDDLVFITPDADGYLARSAPFAAGELPPQRQASAPLVQIHRLSGKGETYVETLPRSVATVSLVASVPFSGTFPSRTTKKVLEIADDLTGKVNNFKTGYRIGDDVSELWGS